MSRHERSNVRPDLEGHQPRPAGPASNGRGERPISELFRDLAHETQTLVRQEIQLAKVELSEKASEAGRGAGLIAAGGFVAYAGLLALVVAVGLLLGTFMPDWLGFLIAGLAVAVAGFALFKAGMNSLKKTDFSLERTAKTLQEDTLWMRQEAQEVKNDPKHMGAGR